MIYYIDIDGTICTPQRSGEYHLARPYKDRIAKVNDLFDRGYTVIYWTARGMASGTDHSELTKKQLTEWGCKYTELKMSKPSYDIFVDDKAVHSEDFFK
jgi:hypothetical protein